MIKDRKYPAGVYAAVNVHPLSDSLTYALIDAVLDTAGKQMLINELDDLSDGLCCGSVLEDRMRALEAELEAS
jgi:hypothetical protein